MKVASLSIGHDALIEFSNLSILARVTLMLVVRMSRHDIVGDLERCLSDGRVEARCSSLCHGAVHSGRIAVGEILWLSSVIGIDSHTVFVYDRKFGQPRDFLYRDSRILCTYVPLKLSGEWYLAMNGQLTGL